MILTCQVAETKNYKYPLLMPFVYFPFLSQCGQVNPAFRILVLQNLGCELGMKYL